MQLPVIRRARGFRLYDAGGRRYVDLWQGGGRLLVGHRSAGIGLTMKNLISRGLVASMPSPHHDRLRRSLAKILPQWRCVLAPCHAAALELARAQLSLQEILQPSDPARGRVAGPLAFWRPFCAPDDWDDDVRCVIAMLPYTLGEVPVPVYFRGIKATGKDAETEAPPAWLTPLHAAAADAGLRALAGRSLIVVPGSAARIGDGWVGRGIYLEPLCSAGEYPGVFARFLDQGFVLSPRFGISILPGEISDGERRRLSALLGLELTGANGVR